MHLKGQAREVKRLMYRRRPSRQKLECRRYASMSIFSQAGGGEKDKYDAFIETLRSVLSNYSGSVCVIASIDLAHVGPRYGDSFQPDPYFLAQVERNDREILAALSRFDRDLFQEQIRSAEDRYRICGYAALTAMLAVIPSAKGDLLDYRRAVMDQARSTVTFASMIFTA